MHTVLQSTIEAGEVLAVALLELVGAIVIVYAIARLVVTPRTSFPRGVPSKVAWVVWSVTFTVQLGHALVPIGALLALRRLRNIKKRQAASQPPDLPFATGTTVRPERER